MITLLAGLFFPAAAAQAAPAAQTNTVTAYDLIVAMNTLRMANGLPALVEDATIDAVAQSTAQIMAANEMSWHIGDVSGRLASAGYGGGDKVWGTENFAVGNMGIDEIMVVWSDASHMIPAVNAAYCNIGAGTAVSPSGLTYYVLQAAYVSSKACGEYTTVGGTTTTQSGSTTNSSGTAGGVSQIVVPVEIATPDAEGRVYHEVKAGQSFWSIAVAYQITIKDLQQWNNLTGETSLQIGQRLFIPGENTEGYATPTPVGMIQLATPDPDGKIVHTVQSYQTLTTIAQAYGVEIDTILNLNGLQIDWPLQIGQQLIVQPSRVTPSPTPRPLTPLEMLTPENDGQYYHTVQSGETLSWIANLYEVAVEDLIAWNGLNLASIIQPNQKLVLQVTPPATITPTPGPPTETPIPTATFTPTTIPTATLAPSPTAATGGLFSGSGRSSLWIVPFGLAAGGILLGAFLYRQRALQPPGWLKKFRKK
ncbi:MAG: LysM peptidoglycan-binding domain-containing protein [Chloroflexi bacterium]|nr:LysM peptidoglycan-binding domain-containing protein [Chloroflexota bacterium]